MRYVNPLLLLDITTLDPNEIRRAKNQQLALLQLSDEGNLSYGDTQVDRSTLLFVTDQLKEARLADYHLQLLQEERLLNFLSFGQTAYFEDYRHQDLWEDAAFRRFIGPFYETQFNPSFAAAFVAKDVFLLRKMQEPEHLVTPGREDQLWAATLRKAEEEYTQLCHFQQRISYSAQASQPSTVSEFLDTLRAVSAIEVWQALPEVFTPLRSQAALMFSTFAESMQLQYPNSEAVIEDYLNNLNQLGVTPQTRQQLEQKHRAYFTKKAAATKRKQRAKQEAANDFIKRIEQLLNTYREGNMRTEVLLTGVTQLFGGTEFNALKNSFSQYDRKLIGRRLRTLAVLLAEQEAEPAAITQLMEVVVQLPIAEKPWTLFDAVNNEQPPSGIEKEALTAVLILETLGSLVSKNRRFVQRHKSHLRQWIALLRSHLTPAVQTWLTQTGSYTLLSFVYDELFPLLYFLRTVYPEDTLDLLLFLNALVSNDNVVGDKAKQLRHTIEQQMLKAKAKTEAEQLAPQGSWQWRKQQFIAGINDIFGDADNVLWFRLGAAAIIMIIIVTLGYRIAFVQTQRVPPPPPPNEPPVKAQIYDIEHEENDFIVQRDSFVGNQLKTYAQAFPLCFGEGVTGGRGSILIMNTTAEDMIANIYIKDSMVVRQAYIRKGEYANLRSLPPDTLGIKLYMGNDWNPLKPNGCNTHGAFDTNPHYWLLRKKLTPLEMAAGARFAFFSDSTVLMPAGERLPIEKGFADISATAYFYIKPDWKRRRDGEVDFSNQ